MFEDPEYNCWDNSEKMAYAAFELYENGQMFLALMQLEEAIEINPNNSAWHFNAGLTLDAMDRFEDAIEAFQKALELGGEDLEVLNSLAVDYTRIGQYDLAISTFEHIQKIDPGFEPCYCNRIITYTEIDRHDKAEEMFYLAQQIKPDCPICFYNIGNSLFTRQEYEKAIWCWEKTAELEPTHPQISYRIAQAHWANGNLRLARGYFLEELRNNPGDIDIILDFGVFLLKCGDIGAAREKFNRIMELDPDSATACFYLGEVALGKGDKEQAIELYTNALGKNAILAGPKYRLGQLAHEAGNVEVALQYLHAECELDIEDSEVLFSMGLMFLQLGDLDYAMNCFLKIIDEDTENAEAFYHLGVTLAMQHEHEGAVQFLEHAVSLGCDDIIVLVDIAFLYLKMRRLPQAAEMIARAGTKDPDNRNFIRLSRRIRLAMLAWNIRLRFFSTMQLRLLLAKYKCRLMRLLKVRK